MKTRITRENWREEIKKLEPNIVKLTLKVEGGDKNTLEVDIDDAPIIAFVDELLKSEDERRGHMED